jgi:hypothetical protein
MQRIANPFFSVYEHPTTLSKTFFNSNYWVCEFQQPLFRGLIEEFMKIRYPLRVRYTLHFHKSILQGFMLFTLQLQSTCNYLQCIVLLFTYLTNYLSTYLTIYLPIYLSIYLNN